MLYRDDSGPHVGRVAPYEPELETAEGNATEDNILGVEIADDFSVGSTWATFSTECYLGTEPGFY